MSEAATPPSERTRVRRLPERGVYERDAIDAILDEALICHLAWVTDEGWPRVIPTIHARVGDTLYIHGSTASRTLRGVSDGREVCVEVTLLDGLVLARSAFHHSMNYRSVVVYGRAREITDPAEKFAAQRALVDHVAHGRAPRTHGCRTSASSTRRPSSRSRSWRPRPRSEPALRRTTRRTSSCLCGPGVLPLHTVPGEPEPAPDLRPGLEPPGYVTDYRR